MSLSFSYLGKTAHKIIEDYISPKRCAFCGYYGKLFCDDCKIILEENSSECPVCRKISYDYSVHQSCKEKTYLDNLRVGYKYNDVAKKIIENFKFKFDKRYGEIIINLILNDKFISNLNFENVVFVPVPLHKKREEWRGFNQSEVLADEIISNLSIRQAQGDVMVSQSNHNSIVKLKLLKRVKETSQQAKLNREKRLENMKDAFEINYESSRFVRNDTTIVLVDDITTTTSTLNECAKVLKESGFKNISALVFARGE